jgi:hypothetical protein
MDDAWDPDNDVVPVSKVIRNSGAKPGLSAPGQSSPASTANKQTIAPSPTKATTSGSVVQTKAPVVTVAATPIKNSIPVAPTPAKPATVPPTASSTTTFSARGPSPSASSYLPARVPSPSAASYLPARVPSPAPSSTPAKNPSPSQFLPPPVSHHGPDARGNSSTLSFSSAANVASAAVKWQNKTASSISAAISTSDNSSSSTSDTANSLLIPLATGVGGVSEINSAILDETQAHAALVRFQTGSGTFARNKLLFLWILFDKVPTIRKAKAGAKRAEVGRELGAINATLNVTSRDELTIENVLEQVGSTIAADSNGSTVSISQIKKDYEAMIAAAAANRRGPSGTKGLGNPMSPRIDLTAGSGRKTLAEIGIEKLKPDAAITALRDEKATSFNWALYSPSEPGQPLKLLNAGSLSVPEMRRMITEELVAFGLLRLSFGSGKFKRTKFIFATICGPKAPITMRGKLAGSKAYMRQALSPYNVELQANDASGLDLQTVIDKVRAASVIDGEDVGSAESAFNIDSFMAGLKEDTKASSSFFGDDGEFGEDNSISSRPAKEIVGDLHSGEISWAVFQVK